MKKRYRIRDGSPLYVIIYGVIVPVSALALIVGVSVAFGSY